MFCANCGNKITVESKYCIFCGAISGPDSEAPNMQVVSNLLQMDAQREIELEREKTKARIAEYKSLVYHGISKALKGLSYSISVILCMMGLYSWLIEKVDKSAILALVSSVWFAFLYEYSEKQPEHRLRNVVIIDIISLGALLYVFVQAA